jgi:hypothetical protein
VGGPYPFYTLAAKPRLRSLRLGPFTGCRASNGIVMDKVQRHDGHNNQLLGALETASRKRIEPHLESIKFMLGDIVCDAVGLLKRGYFPQGSVLSPLTVLEDGSAIETANIGRERLSKRSDCGRPMIAYCRPAPPHLAAAATCQILSWPTPRRQYDAAISAWR